MKKSVLFVVDEQMYGGISSVLVTILNKINLEKYDIDLLILHNRGDAVVNKIPKEINVIYGTEFFKAIDYQIKTVLKSGKLSLIYRKLQVVIGLKTGLIKNKIISQRKKFLKKQYDVEIAFKDGFCALFTSVGDSKKKVSWLHTSYNVEDCTRKYRNLFKEVYSKIDQVIAITEEVADTFNEIYDVKNKTKIIEDLIDSEDVIKRAKLETVDLDNNKLKLVSVGRVAGVKGFPRLITQFERLKKDGLLDDVVLNIIGDGEEMPMINQLIKEKDLEENVILLGYKENPYPYIKNSDMLLLTSFYEGLGLVLVEANILKVPCFATKFANIDKTLENGKYGMIVENSENGIYKGLKDLLENRKKIDEYKENLKNYEYSQEKIILGEIIELFEN